MKDLKEETFFEFYEDSNEDNIIAELYDYVLVKTALGSKRFLYKVYDPEYFEVASWKSMTDIEKAKDMTKTFDYEKFVDAVEDDRIGFSDEDDESDTWYDDYDDDWWGGDDYGFSKQLAKDNKRSQAYNNPTGDTKPKSTSTYYNSNYWKDTWKEPDPIDIEPYCKSDTLVMHLNDPSTEMLSQVYDGKGWDVIRSKHGINDKDLAAIVDRHDRLVFLGHGTSGGLIGFFGSEMAKHIEGKRVFAIWCCADGYFNKNGIGKGQFVTGNMPSEVWECRYAGCGNISRQLMLDNITYWSKLCADVTEDCLNGKVKESVDYIRKNYLEKYGNHPVTIYNANRTQCLGEAQPLPEYTFKGDPLKDDEKPYPTFNEEEFLKNPTESGSDPNRPKYDYYSGGSSWGSENKSKTNSITTTSSYDYDFNYTPTNTIGALTKRKSVDDLINAMSDEAKKLFQAELKKKAGKEGSNIINIYDPTEDVCYNATLSAQDNETIIGMYKVTEEKYPSWYKEIKRQLGISDANQVKPTISKTPSDSKFNLNNYGKELQDQITQMSQLASKYKHSNTGYAYDPEKDIVLKAVVDANGQITTLEPETNSAIINQVKQAYDDALHGRDPYARLGYGNTQYPKSNKKPAPDKQVAQVVPPKKTIPGPGGTNWEEVSIDQYLDELEQEENKNNPPKK